MRKKRFQPELFQYIFDASSLINIAHNKKMTDLRRKKGQLLIPEKVAEEIKPEPPLGRFIASYPQVITKFRYNEDEEYLRVLSQPGIHDGEAAAITVALKRSLPLVIDDRKGKEKAKNHKVKTSSWQDFLKEG